MPKQKRPTGRSSKTGFVLGQAGFAKIAEASSKGLSPDEYRQVIVRDYRKD